MRSSDVLRWAVCDTTGKGMGAPPGVVTICASVNVLPRRKLPSDSVAETRHVRRDHARELRDRSHQRSPVGTRVIAMNEHDSIARIRGDAADPSPPTPNTTRHTDAVFSTVNERQH